MRDRSRINDSVDDIKQRYEGMRYGTSGTTTYNNSRHY
jgi:hypothetical protein